MWDLNTIRSKLQDRLADDTGNFWGSTDLDSYINEAQRQVAAITKGVAEAVSGSVDDTTPYVSLPAKTVGEHADGAYITSGPALNLVPFRAIGMIYPDWRTKTTTGNPRWVAIDVSNNRAYAIPAPTTSKTLNMTVAVLPTDLSLSSDELFDGVASMEKYQGATLNLAATLALLKERYDGDAERFYQFFQQELANVGVAPDEIPPLSQLRQEAPNG